MFLAGSWQHGTFAGVLFSPSLLVMGLFWPTVGLLFFSILSFNNAGNSSDCVSPVLLFLLLVSYLSQIFIKSPYLIKMPVNLRFYLHRDWISHIFILGVFRVACLWIRGWVDRGDLLPFLVYVGCVWFHWRENNALFLPAGFWFFHHKNFYKLMNY